MRVNVSLRTRILWSVSIVASVLQATAAAQPAKRDLPSGVTTPPSTQPARGARFERVSVADVTLDDPAARPEVLRRVAPLLGASDEGWPKQWAEVKGFWAAQPILAFPPAGLGQIVPSPPYADEKFAFPAMIGLLAEDLRVIILLHDCDLRWTEHGAVGYRRLGVRTTLKAVSPDCRTPIEAALVKESDLAFARRVWSLTSSEEEKDEPCAEELRRAELRHARCFFGAWWERPERKAIEFDGGRHVVIVCHYPDGEFGAGGIVCVYVDERLAYQVAVSSRKQPGREAREQVRTCLLAATVLGLAYDRPTLPPLPDLDQMGLDRKALERMGIDAEDIELLHPNPTTAPSREAPAHAGKKARE